MSRPPCCKRDPGRRCPICFTDQVWEMEIPSPIVWEDESTDLIKDGAGDASVGTCGNGIDGFDGSNGKDSHTYISSNTKGPSFDDSLVGTEDGDSLARPAMWRDTGICNQFIGSRIYNTTRIRNASFTDLRSEQYSRQTLPFIAPIYVRGKFYIPSAALLNVEYTKQFQFRTGGERGNVVGGLWERVEDDDFDPRLETNGWYDFFSAYRKLTTFNCTFLGSTQESLFFVCRMPTGSSIRDIEDGDSITVEDYTERSLNDRRVFLRIYDNNVEKIYDTGLTLSDYLDGGILVNIKFTQTGVTVASDTQWDVTCDVEYSIPQSQFTTSKTSNTELFNRCDNGSCYVYSWPAMKAQFLFQQSGIFQYDPSDPMGASFGGTFGGVNTGSNGWRVVNHDPQWWVNELNNATEFDNAKFMFLFPWINDFRIADGTFADSAAFRVASFKHKDAAGVLKLAKFAGDYGSLTIPDGTTIVVGDVETDDVFEIGLDNLGNVTTEVTAITFDDPFITAVDDSTPTLLPYDFQTITFDGEPLAADGTADIVLTHDKNNLLIPSPYTLTLSGTESPGIGGEGPGGGGPGGEPGPG